MFKYLKFAICFLAVAFLVGCGATAPIVKTEHIVVTPTADLMTTCGVSKPPSKEDYPNLSPADKEKALAKYASDLQNDLAKCNDRWKRFPQYFKDQAAVYKDANK